MMPPIRRVPHAFAFSAKRWAGLDDATAESGFVLGIPTLPKTGEGWGTPATDLQRALRSVRKSPQ